MLLDENKARNNIRYVYDKVVKNGVGLRPHFKTHQSAVIGEWFRETGVTAITVSSLDMAVYFSNHGWGDITIAFPVNILQIKTINDLAAKIKLGLLVESQDSVRYIKQYLENPVNIWIKVDTGSHRTGLDWQDAEVIRELAELVISSPKLKLRGILTHAGITYHASSQDEIRQFYMESVYRMNEVRDFLEESGISQIEISVGDTPGIMLNDDFGRVDEIRPGNYVFFDAMQVNLKACREENVAMSVACPVVAKHPQRNEIIIYGGAIHFSKDYYMDGGTMKYGYVTQLNEQGWGSSIPEAYLCGLSQEHGIVHMPLEFISRFNIGDLMNIIPAHSCLVVDLMQEYHTLSGKVIPTLYSEISKSGLI